MLLVAAMAAVFAVGCTGEAQPPAPTAAAPTPTPEVQPTDAPVEKDDSWLTYEGGAMTGDVFSTASAGENGATSSATKEASKIGLEILQQGGNAIDAAVAMVFSVGVTEPASSGMGGAGAMVIYLAEENRYLVLDYMTQAPGGTYRGMIDDSYGARTIPIPGSVHGCLTALEKYGTMTPAEVLAPVIALARNGWEVSSRFNDTVEGAFARLSNYEYSLGLYLNNGTDYYIPGETIANPDLADTLEMIAAEGIKGFYDSAWTEDLCTYLKDNYDAILTREDFKQYKTLEYEPISTTYRGKTVYTAAGTLNGGPGLLEMLNVMDLYDLKALGHDNPETIRITAEAYSLGYKDAVDWIADPAYYNVPLEEMVSKEYAVQRNALLDPAKVLGMLSMSDLTVTLNETGEKVFAAMENEQGGTTHLCAADQYGNMVSSTNTLGVNFGTGISVPGTGFPLSAHLRNLDDSSTPVVNMLMPYARVRSSTAPTIVANEDGSPLLAVGAPGNWAIVNAIGCVISNIIDFDMNVAQAVNAPRFFRESITRGITVEDRYSDATIAGLEGFSFRVTPGGDYSGSVSCVSVIHKDPETGGYTANGDNRRLFMSYAY